MFGRGTSSSTVVTVCIAGGRPACDCPSSSNDNERASGALRVGVEEETRALSTLDSADRRSESLRVRVGAEPRPPPPGGPAEVGGPGAAFRLLLTRTCFCMAPSGPSGPGTSASADRAANAEQPGATASGTAPHARRMPSVGSRRPGERASGLHELAVPSLLSQSRPRRRVSNRSALPTAWTARL